MPLARYPPSPRFAGPLEINRESCRCDWTGRIGLVNGPATYLSPLLPPPSLPGPFITCYLSLSLMFFCRMFLPAFCDYLALLERLAQRSRIRSQRGRAGGRSGCRVVQRRFCAEIIRDDTKSKLRFNPPRSRERSAMQQNAHLAAEILGILSPPPPPNANAVTFICKCVYVTPRTRVQGGIFPPILRS